MAAESPTPTRTPSFALRPGAFLLIALLYPLAYALPMIARGAGYNFENMLFLPLGAMLFALWAVVARPTMSRADLTNLALLLTIFALVAAGTRSGQYLKPISFYAFCIAAHVYLQYSRARNPGLVPVAVAVIYALAATLYVFDESRFENQSRYAGFVLSPTVFSIALQAVLILVLLGRAHLSIKAALYVVFGVFIYASQTRINIAFMLLLPPMLVFSGLVFRFRLLVVIGFIVALNLVYPLYAVYQELYGGGLLSARYSGGEDSSFLLRLAMSAALIEHAASAGPLQLLFGSGAGTSRELMIATFGLDLLPHNDYLQLSTDFGLLAVVAHLAVFYRIAVRNRTAFFLLLLYLVTFYHNLVYSYYLAFLILYYGIAVSDDSTRPGDAAP